MCDPTGGILTTGLLMAGSFAATTAIQDRQRDQANRMMEESTRRAETQAKKAEELSLSEAQKPKRAKPEEALYGNMAGERSGSTTLTGPQGAQGSAGLTSNSLLGA